MIAPSIEFFDGSGERVAIAVVEIFRRTGTGAKKLTQVAKGRT